MTESSLALIPRSKIIRFWSVIAVTIGVSGTTLGYVGSMGAPTPPITSLLIQQQNTLVEVKEDLVTIKVRVGNLEQQAARLTTEIKHLKSK